MTTYLGTRFWPEDPRPQDIKLEDIAHALAGIPRYNAHLDEHYSVAQHCVMGSQFIDRRYARFFLFHDAGESYLGDLITPIKRLFREFYEGIEEGVMQAVASAFRFPMEEEARKAVKRVDLQMLETEARDLVPVGFINHVPTELPFAWRIRECWSPRKAERMFVQRFGQLYA
jgi:hypothetical protein